MNKSISNQMLNCIHGITVEEWGEFNDLLEQVDRLQAENTRLRAERDAAVRDIGRAMCLVCKKYKVSCKPQADELDGCTAFEWRGTERGGEI